METLIHGASLCHIEMFSFTYICPWRALKALNPSNPMWPLQLKTILLLQHALCYHKRH